MNLLDAFSPAGFMSLGGELARQPISLETADAIFNNTPSLTKTYAADQRGANTGTGLSFGTKFLIAAGATIAALYAIRRVLK